MDDEGLLQAVARGDRSAFQHLFVRYAPRVMRLARRMAGKRVDPEEAAQECLLRIWDKAARFDPARGSAEGWIIRVSARLIINLAMSRQGRSTERELADGGERAVATPSDQPGPEERVLSGLAAEDLQTRLEILPDDQRQALVLRHLEGLGIEEIARIMDCPPGTVKSRIFHGVKRLRERCGKETSDATGTALQG